MLQFWQLLQAGKTFGLRNGAIVCLSGGWSCRKKGHTPTLLEKAFKIKIRLILHAALYLSNSSDREFFNTRTNLLSPLSCIYIFCMWCRWLCSCFPIKFVKENFRIQKSSKSILKCFVDFSFKEVNAEKHLFRFIVEVSVLSFFIHQRNLSFMFTFPTTRKGPSTWNTFRDLKACVMSARK